jgi:ABC-type spermidine/putrescine transport system permease subunit II
MSLERYRPQPPKLLKSILPLTLAALYLPLIVMVIGSFVDLGVGTKRFLRIRCFGRP